MSYPALSPQTHSIALAMAALWTWRTRTDVYNFLRVLNLKREDGGAFQHGDTQSAYQELRGLGLLLENPAQPGLLRLDDRLRIPLYRELLEYYPKDALRQAVFQFVGYRRPESRYYAWWSVNPTGTVALLRVALLAGIPEEELEEIQGCLANSSRNWNAVLEEALFQGFDPATFRHIRADLRWNLLAEAVSVAAWNWGRCDARLAPVREMAQADFLAAPEAAPAHARLALAEWCLLKGEVERVEQALAGLDNGLAQALNAALLCQRGRYPEAQAAFEAALKLRQTETGLRKQTLTYAVAWFYPLALLAQQSAKALEQARKFCISESGRKAPDVLQTWGQWGHAIDVRLGNVSVDAASLLGHYGYHDHQPPDWDDFWRLILAAWLGPETLALDSKKQKQVEDLARRLRDHQLRCGLDWLAAQTEAALEILRGNPPPAGFFIQDQREAWRDVLDSLLALGGGTAKPAGGGGDDRLLWSLSLSPTGEVQEIQPLEQKRGPRGWNKPRPVTLNKIAAGKQLAPHDAQAARAIKQEREHARRFHLDLAAAISALVGHPHLVLASDMDTCIELVEGSPSLEVVKEGEHFRMKVTPSPHPERIDELYFLDAEVRREREALRLISVLRESPGRYQLIRLNPEQRRAAQLVSGRFALPANATQEMQQALEVLARHFQVHADDAQAAREVAPETRLRAELSPAGEDLLLRLVAAPLGADGPRLPPASGRERVLAALGGETVGARRDLAAEAAHLNAILDALPFLEDPRSLGGCEWRVSDPELALAMVETLPALAAVAAVEWPKGKPVRVVRVEAGQLGLTVKSERDWFRLAGSAALDDGMVLEFQTLLDAARQKSRFIPLGDGLYAALTQSLKDRLADLAAVLETDKRGPRAPRLAAAWLDDALDGMEVARDRDFRQAIDRLRAAQNAAPPPIRGLQTELRPYQEDGYHWAMRLANAGLGGVLADDMGLGKTLQALAVLLSRSPQGAALVVAPTSVCGNWLAETRRFAPGLSVAIYGETDRDAQVANAGPMDILIVSYTLLQQDRERFAGRTWHTLVADEAQAVKNAAAKRTQALYELEADFRLALSGTPVENRLAELWSIMNFANPGLLGTVQRFNERFASPIERGRSREAQHLLRRIIGPFVLRRTKTQVLQELPPRTELALLVEADAAEAAHYEALRRNALEEVTRALALGEGAQARFNILAQLTKLRRAACDPRLATPEYPHPGAKVRAFAELARELVDNGHKALVFSQFVDFLSLLRQPLDAAGIAYQYLDGTTPAAERTRRVAAFQAGEGDLFLISLKAGGFGLNLTAADYVVITDPWWNPAAEDQASGRAHRIGQQRPVTVYRLVGKGGIEERIVELHQEKRALAEGVLSGEEVTALPSTEDLLALMRD